MMKTKMLPLRLSFRRRPPAHSPKAKQWLVLVLTAFGLAGNPQTASAADKPVAITVQGAQKLAPPPPLQGFLHGFDEVDYDPARVDMNQLAALKPKYWRIGMSDKAGDNYLLAKQLNPDTKITLVLSDQLAVLKGGYGNLRPWENWETYQNDIKYILQAYKDYNLRIDYWDLWNEPDTTAMWLGTCEQAMEMFKRTYETVRAFDATAKIVGPSTSSLHSFGACPESFFVTFIQYITRNNLKFDAIAWHEFDDIAGLPTHANSIRQYFAENMALGMPEIHLNEYSGPADAPLPGWAVGWLYYLEAADVSWASRACWNGCRTGLDGLFLEDNTTPTALYWVHRAYADLPAQRLKANTDTPTAVALAAKNDARQEVSLLVGRLAGKPQPADTADVKITVNDFPYSAKTVACTVNRIPWDASAGLPQGPIALFSAKLPVTKGVLTLSLPAMQDADAYAITFKKL